MRWIGLVGVAGCADIDPRAIEVAKLDGDADAGALLYDADCAECHAEDGAGTPRAKHGDTPVNLATASHWYSAERFLTMIIDGVEGTTMEPWGPVYDDQQLADVYAYILTLKGT